MPEFTFRGASAREALAEPDALLFEYSLRLAEFRAATGGELVDKRVEQYRGTVSEVRGGKLTLKLDDGGTKQVPLNDRRLSQLQRQTPAQAAERARAAAASARAPQPGATTRK